MYVCMYVCMYVGILTIGIPVPGKSTSRWYIAAISMIAVTKYSIYLTDFQSIVIAVHFYMFVFDTLVGGGHNYVGGLGDFIRF